MSQKEDRIVLNGTLQPGTPEKPYAYLPFITPEGVTRLEVSFHYDKGNIVDLGVLDPRFQLDKFPETVGFRGWSGGARDHFWITEADATPGYLPGKLLPGTWYVMLGLYQIREEGCSYRLEVTLGTDLQPRDSYEPRTRHPERAAKWYPSDLHSHTHYSDAKGTLADLLQMAETRGLEVLAVTDHNTCSHHRTLEQADTPLLLVPGQEVTTKRGHANVWGDIGWADFRLRSDADVAALSTSVAGRNGLLSLNHPKNTGYNWEFAIPEHFDCLEVWQMPWAARNWESVALADTLLRQGRRFTFVGGSDRHQPKLPDPDPPCLQVGTPTTWLYLETFTVGGVLEALRRGATCISEGPNGPRLELSVANVLQGGTLTKKGSHPVTVNVFGAAGSVLRYISDTGVVREVAITTNTFKDAWLWRPEGQYLRAEVVGEQHWAESQTRLELESLAVTLDSAELDALFAIPRLRALTTPVWVRT